MSVGASARDPYTLIYSNPANTGVWYDTNGLQQRPANPAGGPNKTLVLFTCGQSNRESSSPTLFIPTHTNKVDQLNINDGGLYEIKGPLLSCTYAPAADGPGNVSAYLADKFVSNNVTSGQIDRVILCCTGIAGTTIADHVTGLFKDRVLIGMARLAAMGINPGLPNFIFTSEIGLGETDTINGITTQFYQFGVDSVSGLAAYIKKLEQIGMQKIFVALETITAGFPTAAGANNIAVRTAQANVVDNKTVFQSADCDTFTGGNRLASFHWSDTGCDNASSAIYAAMSTHL